MRDSFKDLGYAELVTKRVELRKKFLDLRIDMVVHHVDNPLERRNLKRKIARLNTIIHEFALGLRKQREKKE